MTQLAALVNISQQHNCVFIMLQSVRGTVLMMPPVEKFEKMVATVGLLRCCSAISCCEYLHMLEVAIGNFSLVDTAASFDLKKNRNNICKNKKGN